MNFKETTYSSSAEIKNLSLPVLRITALWAFSESTFGGILHALTIPLRGLFISSASVLFISLIALFGKNSKEILKSTLVVVLIKAVVSPYTPLTAFLAVSLQGLLGYLLFLPKKFFKVSALSLGILTLLFSGVQKVILLTILFGNTLWNSIDIFIRQISNEFLGINFQTDMNYGYIILAGYVGIHLIAGFFIGTYAGRLPQKIDHYNKSIPDNLLQSEAEEIPKCQRKKRNWFLRPTGLTVLIVSVSVILFSYLSPNLENSIALEVIFMLIRSVLIIVIWYFLVAPIMKKLFQKFLANKKAAYLDEMNEIIEMFPKFRKVVSYCWKNSLHKKGLSRIKYFLSTSFYYLLLTN